MKITKLANGKKRIRMSESEWKQIGKQAGFGTSVINFFDQAWSIGLEVMLENIPRLAMRNNRDNKLSELKNKLNEVNRTAIKSRKEDEKKKDAIKILEEAIAKYEKKVAFWDKQNRIENSQVRSRQRTERADLLSNKPYKP